MQTTLSLAVSPEQIVNVASVPQRSPFRYAGGKTWLVPRIRQWLLHRPAPPDVFIEPFTGGGSVGLTAAFEDLAAHVLLVEKDADVAAVWHVMLEGDAATLARSITAFDLHVEAVDAALALPPITVEQHAFQTILRNRVNRGGILAPGVGRVKYGENGRGLRSRWYPETLARRILAVAAMRQRMTFLEGDGVETMRAYAHRCDAVFFIDPPYTAAGKRAGSRLYRHYTLDHESLFALAATLAGDFLITYDDTDEVRALAQRHGFDVQAVAMKNTHHAAMTELLIGRDLAWVSGPTIGGATSFALLPY